MINFSFYCLWIFIPTYLFYLCYLLLISKGINLNMSIFWLTAIMMMGLILSQILKDEKPPELILILQIILVTLGFNSIFIIPHVGLFGHDPHWDYSVAKAIFKYGWPLSNKIPNILERTLNLSEWPLLHILSNITSEIFNIDLIIVAKYLPLFLSSIVVFFVYLISRNIYHNIKASLLASLCFSALFWHLFYHSLFIRETIAYVFFLTIIFTISKPPTLEIKIVFIILLLAIVFSHHLTSLILILFSMMILIFNLIYNNINNRFYWDMNLAKNNITLFLLIIVVILSYWLYIGNFTWKVIKILVDDLSLGIYGSYNLHNYYTKGTLRILLGSYGNLAFITVLIITIAYATFLHKEHKNFTNLIFLVWGVGIVCITYLSPFIIPRIEFSRFIVFGYVFLLICFLNISIKLKKDATFIFSAVYLIFQLMIIPPYIYNFTFSPEYEYGRYREYYLPQEYCSVTWFTKNSSISNRLIGDWTVYELFGSEQIEVDYESEEALSIYRGNLQHLIKYDWFVFRDEDFYCAKVGKARITAPVKVTNEIYDQLNSTQSLFNVYDNREVKMYKIISW